MADASTSRKEAATVGLAAVEVAAVAPVVVEKRDRDASSAVDDNQGEGPLQSRKRSKHEHRQHVRKKDLSPQVLDVRRRIQQCCKLNDLVTAMEVYEQAIGNNVRIEAQSFYNLLNLCDGLNDRGVHIGTPKPTTSTRKNTEEVCESKPTDPATDTATATATAVRSVDAETRQQHAFRIKQHMDDMKLPLNETAYTALVRLLSRAKLVDQAEELLAQAERVSQCKARLRLYSALLCAYCEMGRMKDALKVWTRLVKRNLALTEREYAALIQCAVTSGDASIMERVLSDFAEDVLVPSRDTTRLIADWFASPHAVVCAKHTKTQQQGDVHSVELPTSDAPSMGPVQCKGKGWTVTFGCMVNTDTGVLTTGCLEGVRLRPVALSDMNWNEMKQMNETIVLNGMLDKDKSAFQGGGKGPKRQAAHKKGGTETRRRHWKQFQSYLEERKHFDVVVDGANVGYYKQNFANAPKHVDYRQIDDLLQHFANQSKSILLVMHERHFYSRLVPSWAVPIVDSWSSVLYRTPAGMNDDWFWMHAALWSGRDTLVVTNDEMRDHFFQMLAPRSFLRWKERHQVHFHFVRRRRNDEADDESPHHHRRLVELTYPETYSRRIQRVLLSDGKAQPQHGDEYEQHSQKGLVVPLPKRGDEHRYLDGSHTADGDCPAEETYLCIRPARK